MPISRLTRRAHARRQARRCFSRQAAPALARSARRLARARRGRAARDALGLAQLSRACLGQGPDQADQRRLRKLSAQEPSPRPDAHRGARHLVGDGPRRGVPRRRRMGEGAISTSTSTARCRCSKPRSGWSAACSRPSMRAAIRCCSPRRAICADRLLPSFNASPLGIPHRFINLRTGAVRGPETNPAETGTFIPEFGFLSRRPATIAIATAAKRALVVDVRAALEDRPARRRDRLHDRRVEEPPRDDRAAVRQLLRISVGRLGPARRPRLPGDVPDAAPRAILQAPAADAWRPPVVRRRRFRNRQAHQLGAGRARILLWRPARAGRSARVRRGLHAQLGRGSEPLRRASRRV